MEAILFVLIVLGAVHKTPRWFITIKNASCGTSGGISSGARLPFPSELHVLIFSSSVCLAVMESRATSNSTKTLFLRVCSKAFLYLSLDVKRLTTCGPRVPFRFTLRPWLLKYDFLKSYFYEQYSIWHSWIDESDTKVLSRPQLLYRCRGFWIVIWTDSKASRCNSPQADWLLIGCSTQFHFTACQSFWLARIHVTIRRK